MSMYYIEVDGVPVAEPDALKWAAWFNDVDRRTVARTEVAPEVVVSTVFLGIDHAFQRGAAPVLYETMVFGESDEFDHIGRRYCTREQAEAGHTEVVKGLAH